MSDTIDQTLPEVADAIATAEQAPAPTAVAAAPAAPARKRMSVLDIAEGNVDLPFMDDSSFASLYEKTLTNIKQDELIRGKVVSMTKDSIFVDIGFKSLGVVPRAEFISASVLEIGEEIDVFVETIEDSTGKLVSSKTLLKQGSMVLTFYRGSWCPFCNTYLRKLGQRMPDIKAAGGHLVAISQAERPESMSALFRKIAGERLSREEFLAIVRDIVKELDGEIELDDAKEGGACFRIYLPMSTAQLPDDRSAAVSSGA